ncbi:transposase [Ancylostoma ceylanicum]|uniref:Transposase n=1 Tax=Ancylostoma ceylanicum TaxID=53326 RepID=A0A0D6L4G7_9BILA|nr:transposase [Ancylostoma ceylanicum]
MSVHNAMRPGRPRITTTRNGLRIVRISESDPTLTSVDIAAEFKASDELKISPKTVGRRLRASDLIACRPVKKNDMAPAQG